MNKTILNSWPTFFKNFFGKNQDRIIQILDASSCREIWMQGEMYLNAPGLIRPNSYEFPGDRVDLHGLRLSEYPEMIAEMKVISYRGYACSDIFGCGGRAALKSSMKRCNYYAPAHDTRDGSKMAHSLYKDFRKLQRIKSKKVEKKEIIFTGEKYLILVIPHKESAAGSKGKKYDAVMHEALEKIMFSLKPDCWEWDFKDRNDATNEKAFSVRIWRV